jgi:hypothetical protein
VILTTSELVRLVLGLLLGAALAWAALSWQVSRRRALMRPLASVLDGQAGEMKGVRWLSLSGRYRDRAVTLRQRKAGEYRAPRFEILLECRSPLGLRVGREGELAAELALWLHVAQDVEIGDPKLDRDLVFRSPEPGRLVAWLRAADAARAALGELMAGHGASSLTLRDPRLHYSRAGWTSWPSPDEAREILERMRTIAESAERA